jgi:2-oxoglutarate ferredoxin oxidoreductase subunit beta
VLRLHKMAKDLDPFNRGSAMMAIEEHRIKGDILTGLIYLDKTSTELHELMQTSQEPLNQLSEEDLCPGNRLLKNINAALR